MARNARDKQDDTGSIRRGPGSGLIAWLLLGGGVVLGAVLRMARLGESPGGFLAFNEYFYLDLAERETHRAPLAWFYDPLDLDHPPLFDGLAAGVLSLHVPPVIGLRLISVIAGVATILLVFLLGKTLYDGRTASVAAAAFALMPGVVMVNHNIQVDSVFVALMVAGVLLYVRSARSGSLPDAIFGGILLGLSLLAKQPALLALVALLVWRTWAQRGIGWLRDRRTWAFVACTLGLGGSWYAARLLFAPQEYFSAIGVLAGERSMRAMGLHFVTDVLFGEFLWMVFPLAALVMISGLVVAARRRSAGDLLVLVFFTVYLVYYVGFHKHSYYLLPITPFVALLIARGVTGAFEAEDKMWGARASLASVLLLSMALGSFVMMGGKKWGRWAPADVRVQPSSGNQRVHLYYNPKLDTMYYLLEKRLPAEYHLTPMGIEQYFSKSMPPESAGTQRLYLSQTLASSDEQGREQLLPANRVLTETQVRPMLCGYAIGESWTRETRAQTFKNGPWTAEKVGFLWQFGMHSQEVKSDFALYD